MEDLHDAHILDYRQLQQEILFEWAYCLHHLVDGRGERLWGDSAWEVINDALRRKHAICKERESRVH